MDDFERVVADLRTRLHAVACSCALVRDDGGIEYVAADGQGAAEILGVRLPAGRGLVGWSVSSGQSLGVRDVRADPRFAADVAASTGYLPDAALVAPFFAPDGSVRGVLTVLDPDRHEWSVLPMRDLETAAAFLTDPELPAGSSAFEPGRLSPVRALPIPDLRSWAIDGATGAGVRVAVVDSGVDGDHPRVGGLAGSIAFEPDDDARYGFRTVAGPHRDLVGHGTACAAIIRSLAPDAEIVSVRVLGSNLKGRGSILRAGIAWAVEHDIDVANLSLSSRSPALFGPLHEVVDAAYFAGTTLVSAVSNVPGASYPSQYASVVSVASAPVSGPGVLVANPRPPAEFGAHGIDVDVAWTDGGTTVATGNSFAAPHVAGIAALVRSKHPHLTPYQLKSVLHALSANAAP